MTTQYNQYSSPYDGFWGGYYGSNFPRYVGDNNTSTYWTVGTMPCYVYFECNGFKNYVITEIASYDSANSNHPKNVDVDGGTLNGDGTVSWTNLASNVEWPSASAPNYGTLSFSNSVAYRCYRIKILSKRSGTTYPRIYELQFRGPDGQNPETGLTNFATADKTYTDSGHYLNHPFSLAFDGDGGTFYEAGGTNQWCKIDLGTPKVCTRLTFYQPNDRYQTIGAFSIHGSNDDSDWTQLLTGTNESRSNLYIEFNWTNTTPYRYYRLTFTIASAYLYVYDGGLWGLQANSPASCKSTTTCEAIQASLANLVSLTTVEAITLPLPGDCRSPTVCQALLLSLPHACISKTVCRAILLDGGDFFLAF
jgi:hypothetical protein